MEIRAGDRFGRYEIRALLGHGAMGEVFRAYDPRLQREVAIKRIGAAMACYPNAVARFEQEARAASALNHPNIVSIYDTGEETGQPFIVMELLEGESLRSLLGRPAPLESLLRIGLQIADALTAAHDRGIAHRDLKPENIFVTRAGVAKVLDFGLARICQPTSEDDATQQLTVERLTERGVMVGTLGYAAPEVLSGGAADTRADIFAFGAILYEMVSGRPAFRGRTAAETLAATLRDEPAPVETQRADVPAAITRLIERCLRKAPADRADTRRVRDELRQAMESTAPAGSPRPKRAPLPAPRTPLIGRETELAKITALLSGQGARVVTLTGAGGAGKTRLALAVAAQLQTRFGGEIFFIPLATISDVSGVAPAIARSVGISGGASDSPLSAVIAELNATGFPALLILDNFEQVIGAASDVSELVAACPTVSVLITSRELLHLYGEHDVTVLPLPVPDPDLHRTAAAVGAVPSAALFVGRATASDPGFTLRDQDAAAVAEICRRLDGLPLALELAAARVRMMPPAALLARLDQRLQVLTSGARDMPDRQHTLRRTIDWSHDLLTPAEQTLFRRLSVFTGGFTLEAAEAVADPFGKLGIDLVDGMTSLVDKSLLQRQEDESGGERRFFMLQTIREYAAGLLTGTEDEERARRAHAAYLLVLGEEAAQVLATAESPEWLARLAREHDNFRAALDWLTATQNVDWGLRMALSLFYFWERTDHLWEGRRRLTALLELAGDDHDDGVRARALHALGIFAAALHDNRDAVMRMEMSLAMHRRRGDQHGVAVAHNALGIQFTELEDYARASRHLEEALVAWDGVANESGYARSLSNLAFVRRKQGQYDDALRLHQDAAARFEGLGDHLSSAWALNHQGDIARDQELWAEAMDHYRNALERFRALSDDWGAGSSLADLGTVACRLGDTAAAAAFYREALQLFANLGHRRGMARILEVMSILEAEHGSSKRALILSGAAAQLRQKIGLPGPITDPDELTKWIDLARRSLASDELKATERRAASMSLPEIIRFAGSLADRAAQA